MLVTYFYSNHNLKEPILTTSSFSGYCIQRPEAREPATGQRRARCIDRLWSVQGRNTDKFQQDGHLLRYPRVPRPGDTPEEALHSGGGLVDAGGRAVRDVVRPPSLLLQQPDGNVRSYHIQTSQVETDYNLQS